MSINVKNKTLVDWIVEKRACKRASGRVYASNLRRIHKEFSKKKFHFDLKWLKEDASSILKKISKMQNVNTARNLMSAALVAFSLLKDESNIQKYNAVLKQLNEKKNYFKIKVL
jgi:ribosome maturation protein Sdo1